MPHIYNISIYKYAGVGVMVNVENKNDVVFPETDLWVRASAIRKLNDEVEEDERKENRNERPKN
ncbi:MAG: hypothetical protein ABSC54_09505 [Smithellaceae bacterium]|jgi:hypothetical protein